MTPENTQQESESLQERISSADLESDVAELYDKMAAEDEVEDVDEEVAETETEEEVEEVTAEAEDAAEEDQPPQEEDIEPEDTVEWDEPAPERWPAELKEVYNELPPEARQAMLEGIYKPMQRQYGQTTQELAQMRKQVEPMLEAMTQYRNDFERMGVDPAHAFRTQMAWAAHLAKVGPEQGLKDMSAAYGLDTQPQGQEEEQYLTPVERSMQSKIDELSRQVQGVGQTQHQATELAQAQAYQARYNDVQTGMQSFINEQKDGKPAHPHVERVAPAIAGLIRGGMVNQTDDYGQPVPVRDQLAQAYKMACDLDPSIRSASGTSGRQVQRAKSAQKVGVVANEPVGEADVPALSVAEQLDAEYDRLSRRVG